MLKLHGEVSVPGSKSHTIRALLIAALTEGESSLLEPLVSQDTLSAKSMIKQFGAGVAEQHLSSGELLWRVRGIPVGERESTSAQPIQIDVGNSGTSLYLGTAVAALFQRPVRFDGDASIRQRSAANLLKALEGLGARVVSQRQGEDQNEEQNYCCPYTVEGPLSGGSVRLSAPTSQYLSALLLALPLTDAGCHSEIVLDLLNEHPYVDMTLEWLQQQGIQWQSQGYDRYTITGGQKFTTFQRRIPADYSSATFFFCAAAISGSQIRLHGLNPNDVQGDKQTLEFLRRMGCEYRWEERQREGEQSSYMLEFTGPPQLIATELDLAQTPDALPAMAVACACADGQSRIGNVAHARSKETDRIACMAKELQMLGFSVEEQADGLLISGGTQKFLREPRQRIACGYHDHRIIMALSLLNLLQPEDAVVLDDCSYAAVTFPGFFQDMQRLCGATLQAFI